MDFSRGVRFSLCTEDDDIVQINHKNEISNKAFVALNEMRQAGHLCDIVLDAGTRRLRAHKIVLSAVIPYFRLMFTTDMLEATLGQVTLHELDGDTLDELISYAYSGELRISAGNVQSIMIGANFLQLDEVVDECASFLVGRLSPSNILAICSFCSSLGCQSIKNSTLNFIRKHFVTITETDDFLQLPMEEAFQLLSDDFVYIESEEDVFNAVIRWILHSPDRKIFASKLLSCVRLHLLKPSFLSDHVASHSVVKCDLACRDLVDEAKDYHLIPERRSLARSFRLKPRCCNLVPGLIFAIGGLSSSNESSAVEMYDPLIKKWASVKPMPSVRSRVGVAVYDKEVYAIGGFDGSERLHLVEKYSYNKNEWTPCASLISKRSALGAVFLNSKLYVCGGYDGISSLNSVEIYNPETNIWIRGPPMLKQRSAAGVVALDGYIYVMGGHDGMSIFNSVERFIPEKGIWEAVQPMITKRCRVGAAVLNGKIYVCGGYDGSQFLSSTEVLDPVTLTWSPVTPMLKKRSRVALVSSADTLYAIAGYDGISNLSSIEIFTEESQQWSLGPPMITHGQFISSTFERISEGGVGVACIPISPQQI